MNERSAPYDIAVVGLGITGIHQITREAEETIRRCRQTYVTDMAVGVLEHLTSLAPEVVDMTSRYELGSHRIAIYRRMASEVVTAAMEDGPVCFATYGHPLMYCYPTTLIQRAAKVLDLEVWVLPGVSFIDTLLVDLGVDPGADGLQLYEATDLVVRRRPLQNDVGCVIVQAPIVLEAYNQQTMSQRDNLEVLQSHLLEFYPADHEALFTLSRTHPLLDSVTQRFAIGKLAASLERATNVGTLYIPPVGSREVREPDLAERMRMPEDDGKGSRRPPRREGRPDIGPAHEA